MRQILYASWSTAPGGQADLAGILEQSRHNNALEGVTGVLWADGWQFVQILEGPEDSVGATFERIRADSRHHSVLLLHDAAIEARQFGDWSMMHRRARDAATAADVQLRRLLSHASPEVQEQFLALIAAGAVTTA